MTNGMNEKPKIIYTHIDLLHSSQFANYFTDISLQIAYAETQKGALFGERPLSEQDNATGIKKLQNTHRSSHLLHNQAPSPYQFGFGLFKKAESQKDVSSNFPKLNPNDKNKLSK